MSLITDTWRQLVRRRLWPVALGLLAALAAVPVVLAREPEVAPSPAKAQPVAAGAEATEPVVALAGEGSKDARRRVLGASKDPFEPARSQTSKRRAKTAQTAPPSAAPESTSGSSGGGDTGAGSTSGDAVEPIPELPGFEDESDPDTPEVTYPRFSISVNFGEGDELKEDVIDRGEALPDEDDPVLIYLGVSKDGRRAVFMLNENATTEGDGTCKPSPEDCESLELAVGETEFIEVKDDAGTVVGSYQLDVLKIHKGTSGSAKSSKDGLRSLEARDGSDGPRPDDYDARMGTVESVGTRALEDAVDRAGL
jgi:hypothetical protein